MAADLLFRQEMFRHMQKRQADSKGKLAKMIHEMSQKELDVADLETGILNNTDNILELIRDKF